METSTQIIFPWELGEGLYADNPLPAAQQEPEYQEFECGACGGRHGELVALIGCATLQRERIVSQLPVELVAA
jgi:hypothetical protein